VGEAGIEPTTPGLEGRCSIRLSYSPTFINCICGPEPIEIPEDLPLLATIRSKIKKLFPQALFG
jgi:hypothetical protein